MKKINRIILPVILLAISFANAAAQQPQQQQQPQSQPQQKVTVKGTVFEKGGAREPFPYVAIIARDPQTKKNYAATTTGAEGKFVISAPVGSELYFSFISHNPVTWQVKKETLNLIIYMEEIVNTIEDVVIVGYQPKSRAAVTSSIVRVDAKDLAAMPVANITDLLQGHVPGMEIRLNNGLPGAQGQINIRGVSDISLVGNAADGFDLVSATPLFVVDGVPRTDVSNYDTQGLISGSGVSPISDIPFEDIDNIQVLKDAAATSLYGSDGAYGVILIETKKGNTPVPVINYSGNFTVSTPPNLREIAIGNAERNLRMWQILGNDTSRWHGYNEIMFMPSIVDSLNPYWNNHTDWQGQFYRVTYNQSHNLSFSGGDTGFDYKINGNYYTEKGIVKNTDFNRYALSSQMGYRPNRRFSVSMNLKVGFLTNSTGSGNAVSQSGVAKGATASSLLPPPSLYTASAAALQVFSINKMNTSFNYEATTNLTYRLPFDVNWTGTFSYTYGNKETEEFTPAVLADNNYQAITYNASSNSSKLYVRTFAQRSFKLSLLRLGLRAGIEYTSNKDIGNNVTFTGLPNDYILGPVGHGISGGTANATENKNTFSVIFDPDFGIQTSETFQLGADKYVFTPSIRPEISSIYGSKTKWIIQPALGLRWNIWMEPFMKRFTKISNMALRATWGRVVKYKASRYDVWGVYNINPEYTYYGEPYIPIDYGKLPSAFLDPVTTTTWNVGHEAAYFNSRLRTEIDAYYRQVDNQLRDVTLPDHSGFDNVKSAETSLVNYGLEVSLTGQPLPVQSDWNLTCNLNFAINRDIITKLPNEARQILNTTANVANRLGMNTTSMLLYINKGVYANDEDVPVDPVTGRRLRVGGNNTSEAYFKAGDPIWVDINGDYIIDEDDKVVAGDASSRVNGGFWFNLSYKNFSIHTSTAFVLRRDVINVVLADRFDAYRTPLLKTNSSLQEKAALAPIEKYSFWSETNRYSATYPNPFDYIHNEVIRPFRADQTLFLEDGSYFKISGISMAYRLPKFWINFFRVRSVSLKASISNIWTVSGYSGISPESVNGLGRDVSGGYPNKRTWTMGVTIGL